jgi:hypothetical protein
LFWDGFDTVFDLFDSALKDSSPLLQPAISFSNRSLMLISSIAWSNGYVAAGFSLRQPPLTITLKNDK